MKSSYLIVADVADEGVVWNGVSEGPPDPRLGVGNAPAPLDGRQEEESVVLRLRVLELHLKIVVVGHGVDPRRPRPLEPLPDGCADEQEQPGRQTNPTRHLGEIRTREVRGEVIWGLLMQQCSYHLPPKKEKKTSLTRGSYVFPKTNKTNFNLG